MKWNSLKNKSIQFIILSATRGVRIHLRVLKTLGILGPPDPRPLVSGTISPEHLWCPVAIFGFVTSQIQACIRPCGIIQYNIDNSFNDTISLKKLPACKGPNFLRLVNIAKCVARADVQLELFCWVSNHFHIQINFYIYDLFCISQGQLDAGFFTIRYSWEFISPRIPKKFEEKLGI